MKNLIKPIMFVMFLLIPVSLFAQGSESVELNDRPQASPNSLSEDSNFVVSRSVSGNIVGIKEGIITIKTDKNKEIRIGLSNRTKYKVGKKFVKTDEIDPQLFADGRDVKITYVAFEDKQKRFDKIAVEVRFPDDKEKQKPSLTTNGAVEQVSIFTPKS